MRAAKAAIGLKDSARRLTEQLVDFVATECSTSSIDYILAYALPVLKDSIGALSAETPVAPCSFLALHLLQSAGVPGGLVDPIREWLRRTPENTKISSPDRRDGSPLDQRARVDEKVARLLGSRRAERGCDRVDHKLLNRVMMSLDPTWSWSEDNVRQLVELAERSGGSEVSWEGFLQWLFSSPAVLRKGDLGIQDPAASAEDLGIQVQAALVPSERREDIGVEPATTAAPGTDEARPQALLDQLEGALPRLPPQRAKGKPPPPPPPGRPPPPGGPPRAKSQPAAKGKAKAAPLFGRGRGASQPPEKDGLSLAERLERRRGHLRSSPQPAAARDPAVEEEPAIPILDPEALAAEERERPGLVADLERLAASTPLGVVEAAAVEPVEAKLPSSAEPILGRGRFASVIRATVERTVSHLLASWAPSASSNTPVAAKRFACSARRFSEEGPALLVVPLTALLSARREAEALLAVAGHPNIVELLGLVLPPAVAEPVAAGSPVDAGVARPLLQLLLRPSQGSLFGLLGDTPAWEALGRMGRVSILQGVARGLEALHNADFAHLDIKSHNILIDRPAEAGAPPSVRLCDLGSARRVGAGEPPPPPEGTSGWAAPELLEPPVLASKRADPRLADVFSFGVVVWEVVAGPGALHPLCGLAGEVYCRELAKGQRPEFPASADACSEEAELAFQCWQFEATKRPPLSKVLKALDELHGRLALSRTEAASSSGEVLA